MGLNHTYKLVWNRVKSAFVCAPETARSRGKSGRTQAIVGAVAGIALSASGATLADPVSGDGAPEIVDGGGKRGVMVMEDTTVSATDPDGLSYTNFFTEGGAGSGGGAGLGGVFFVNEGATLTLNNISFASNAVKGGEGGSTPAISVDEIAVGVKDKVTSVGSVTSFQLAPTLVKQGDNYFISGVALNQKNPLVKEGVQASVAGAAGSTRISSISEDGKSLTFQDKLQISSGAITSVVAALHTTNTNSISITPPTAGGTDPYASLVTGELLVGNGNNVPAGTTVTNITRNTDGFVTGITFSQAFATTTGAEIISLRSMDTTQFSKKAGNVLGINAVAFGLETGMALTGEGIPSGTIITAINSADGTVTLSNAITGTGFDAVNRAVSADGFTVQLASPDGRIKVGMTVNIGGQDTKITAVNSNGSIRVANAITASVPDDGLVLKASSVTGQNGNTLTLLSTAGLKAGMIVSGNGLETKIVSVVGDKVILESLDGAQGPVTGFKASSPLRKGGSMNGISATGTVGDNGGNGISARVGSSFLNEGEGLPGTNGLGADDGEGAAGGDGGNGGNGSDGMPFNYALVKDIIETTFTAVAETAEATSNFATFPPAGAEAAVHFANAIFSYASLAEQVANLVLWNVDLVNGTTGLGGAGGDGGEGGSGSDFFGGGAGGDGGNAGNGALQASTGEDGGNGAKGGTGGFGAGGGSGGAGGDAGSVGRAADGDPGDGGDAGFGAGAGSRGDGIYGEGGSGFGGAIFVRENGNLIINGNSVFENNTTLAGSSNNRGSAGEAAGFDIFMMKGADVLLAPGSGNTITIKGGIADNSNGTYDGASWAAGDGADLRIGGGGLVELLGQNTYTGDTISEGATLFAEDGVGINTDSHIVFKGTGKLGNMVAHSNAGVLLAEGTVTRRVGTLPHHLSWDGAGGYAASSEDDLVLNFGAVNDSIGQALKWNSNAISDNSVMVFGSEYGQGSVVMLNNIDINGHTAKMAVYDSALTDSDSATLSGKLTNGSLAVGNAGYDGTLYLTGKNTLTNLALASGTLSTEGGGRVSGDNGTNVTITGGSMVLENAEKLNVINVESAGTLTAMGEITSSAGMVNNGTVELNAGGTFDAIVNDGTVDIGGSTTVTKDLVNLNNGVVNVNAELTVIDSLFNVNVIDEGSSIMSKMLDDLTAVLNQRDTVTGTNIVNNTQWNVIGDRANATRTINTSNLTGTGTFSLETNSYPVDFEGESVDQQVVSNLHINQFNKSSLGTSTFSGLIEGAGKVEKSGNGTLKTDSNQTFTGGLQVQGGAIEMLNGGLLADTLDIQVMSGAAFYAKNGRENDTVNSIQVDAASDEDTNGYFGQEVNFTVTDNVAINGEMKVTDGVTLTTTKGGLTGSGQVAFQKAGGSWTLNQAGNTTYSGSISESVNTNTLVKTGIGSLTLNGSAGAVSTETINIVEGELVAASANVLGAAVNVLVADTATLSVTANQKLNSIQNNSVDTVNQSADITTVATGNGGTWNVLGDSTRTLTTDQIAGNGTFVLATDLDLNITKDTSTYNGVFSGAGALEKLGAGELALKTAQTFTGGLDVSAGVMTIEADASLADALAVTVGNDALLNMFNGASGADLVTSLKIDQGGKVVVDTALSTTNNMTVNGELTNRQLMQRIANANTVLTMENGGLTGSSTGKVLINGNTITVNQGGDTTYSGEISDGNSVGNFIKTGTGTLTLNGKEGALDVAGDVVIRNGELALAGEYIMASTLNVDIVDEIINGTANIGKLLLVSGNQKINSLKGGGSIELGANNLDINDGGNFEGKVSGSGALNILGGSFTVANEIISTEGTFTTNSDATTTVANGKSLSFPEVSVANKGVMDVAGTINSDTVIVAAGGNLHLGDRSNNGQQGVVNSANTTVDGELTGQGSLSGHTIITAGGKLSPGNSPGQITFSDLTLAAASSTDMELWGANTAGTDFDQINVTGQMAISTAAELNLLDTGSFVYEPAMGDVMQVFKTEPGHISGHFGKVTSNFNNNVMFNVATGSVIGLGNTTYNDFMSNTVATANQQSMLNSLYIGDNGGVAQSYGGRLVERLAVNNANRAAQQAVFAKASPEAYVGLLDQSRMALTHSLVSLPGAGQISDAQSFVSVNYRNAEHNTDNGSDFVAYQLQVDAAQLHGTYAYGNGAVAFGYDVGTADLTSRHMKSDIDNTVFSAGIAHSLSDTFSATARAGWLSMDSSSTRHTSGAPSKAKSVDGNGWIAGLGLDYERQLSSVNLVAGVEVLNYSVDVDAFSETNSDVLDALDVSAQSMDGTAVTAKLGVSKQLTPALNVGTGFSVTNYGGDNRFAVDANVQSEPAMFRQLNDGLGDSIIGMDINASYTTKNWVFGINGSLTGEDSFSDDYRVNLGLKYKL